MRRKFGPAVAAVTLLLAVGCGGSGPPSQTAGTTSVAPVPTGTGTPSKNRTAVEVDGPALTREHLLQWGSDCRAAPSSLANLRPGIGFLVCPAAELPAADGSRMNAACASLRLANAAPPQADIVLDVMSAQTVTLYCDQGTPRADASTFEASRQRPGPPGPAENLASVSVVVPEPGTTLHVTRCDTMPSRYVCHQLGQNQPGTVSRDSINWYYGPGHPVHVEVEKPSVGVAVSRSYNSNGDQVDVDVMVADQKAIVTALNALDTAGGFVPIDSTAGCCER